MPDLPASHRLRIGRYGELSRIYLLTTNTVERKPIFQDFALGRLVVEQFRFAQDKKWAKSLAWVVMPDHFHWLIELQQGSLKSAQISCAKAYKILSMSSTGWNS